MPGRGAVNVHAARAIDRQRAREAHRPHGVADAALDDGARRAPRRARLAARAPCRRRAAAAAAAGASATTSPPIRDAAARLRDGATDIVFLGTGGSSLGGQTLAQLAGYAVPGVGALARRRRACISWTISIRDSFGALLAQLPLATTRFVAISKSGGTGETLMQTIAALVAVKAAGLEAASPNCSSASPSRPKPASATACAICSAAHQRADARPRSRRRRPLLGADQCRPAAGGGARPRHRRDPRRRRGGARAGARRTSRRPRCRPRSAPRSRSRWPRARARRIAVMMAYADRLERFTRWYVQLWAESLGKDGKGTTPIARSGRSTSTASCSSSSPARATSCSPSSPSTRAGPRPAHRRRSRQARRRAGFRRQDHRRSGRGAGPRHRRDAGQERLPGAHHPSRRSSTRRASASC